MMHSKKVKVLFIVAMLIMVAGTQAFADARLQGYWHWEGDLNTQLLINGSSFVWLWVDGTTFTGTVSVSGNLATFMATHARGTDNVWRSHGEIWNYAISFQTNNRLIINDWVYLRM